MFLLFWGFFSFASAQPVRVRVLDPQGNPLSGVHVRQQGAGGTTKQAITDQEGEVLLFFEGEALVRITSVGYRTRREVVSASSGPFVFVLEPHTIPLQEMVVTGQLIPSTAAQSVRKIRVLNRERIEKQGAVVLSELLANEVNIGLSQDGVLGGSASIQGISGQNVGIMVDGVPVLGRLNGSVDTSQIFLHDVERIEIVEGSSSVGYGNNNLAGLIHIITRRGGGKEGLRGQVSSYYESVGQYNLILDGGLSRPRYWVSVSTGGNYFDGWSEESGARAQQWNPKRQYFSRFQYGRKLRSASIRFHSALFDERLHDKGAPDSFRPRAFDDQYRTFRMDHSLFFSRPLGKQELPLELTFSHGYYRRTRRSYVTNTETDARSVRGAREAPSIFDMVLARGTYPVARGQGRWRFQIGYDFRRERAYGPRIRQGVKGVDNYALFSSAEWTPHDMLTLRGGFRYAYNTLYRLPPIPSFHLKYTAGASVFRASYARGFRAPALKELYLFFVDVNHNVEGNPSLRHEHSHNAQCHWNWRAVRGEGLVFTELGGYYNDIKDLIALAQTRSLTKFSYINVGVHKTFGVQARAGMEHRSISVMTGGGYAWIRNRVSANDDVSRFSPVLSGNFNCSYEWKPWRLGIALFYKYTGAGAPQFILRPRGEVQALSRGYHTADFTCTKHLWKEVVSWKVGVKNIFNVMNGVLQGGGGGGHSGGDRLPIAWGRSYFTKLVVKI